MVHPTYIYGCCLANSGQDHCSTSGGQLVGVGPGKRGKVRWPAVPTDQTKCVPKVVCRGQSCAGSIGGGGRRIGLVREFKRGNAVHLI